MVNIKELRIGNYVMTTSEEPELVRIEGIKTYDHSSDDDCVMLQSLDGWYPLSAITPVVIDREILERTGFRFFRKSGFVEIYERDDEPKIGFRNITISSGQIRYISEVIECEFLHQLQNLCYDLVKLELSVRMGK